MSEEPTSTDESPSPELTRRESMAAGAGSLSLAFLGFSMFENVSVKHGGTETATSAAAIDFNDDDFSVENDGDEVAIALSDNVHKKIDAANKSDTGSTGETGPTVQEYALGPAELKAGDFAQRTRYIPEGKSLTLTGWSARESEGLTPTPSGLKLVLVKDDTEVLRVDAPMWSSVNETIEGPADVYFQLENQSPGDFTAASEVPSSWAAATFQFEVK